MRSVVYEIVEHDGGWAYKLGEVLSETYPSHDAAYRAAEDAAMLQDVDSVEIRSPRDPEALAAGASGAAGRDDAAPTQALPSGDPKVDLRTRADALVDSNFDAGAPDEREQVQEELAERKADRNR